jgi:hypothetical protein
VTGERVLPLVHGVNPAWAALQTLREQAVQPVFGEALTALSEAQWEQLKTMLASASNGWPPARPRRWAPDEAEVQACCPAAEDRLALLDHDDAEKEHACRPWPWKS